MTSVDTILLSFVLPYFRKYADLAQALPRNLQYFAHPACEVVLVLDEPSEAAEVLELVHATVSDIRWRVIVNDRPHAWRPPSKAINVGIRHALGELVLVASPESVFVDDPVAFFPDVRSQSAFAVGCVAFATYAEFLDLEHRGLERAFQVIESSNTRLFYGSLLAPRASFNTVTGYDESLDKWGGDDDNLRARFALAGLHMIQCDKLRVIHLSALPRRGLSLPPESFPKERIITPLDERRLLAPASYRANSANWGTDFGRTLFDWRHARRGRQT
jgi:hypothetical protein